MFVFWFERRAQRSIGHVLLCSETFLQAKEGSKPKLIAELRDLGAKLAFGNIRDVESLKAATKGVDVVVSCLSRDDLVNLLLCLIDHRCACAG